MLWLLVFFWNVVSDTRTCQLGCNCVYFGLGFTETRALDAPKNFAKVVLLELLEEAVGVDEQDETVKNLPCVFHANLTLEEFFWRGSFQVFPVLWQHCNALLLHKKFDQFAHQIHLLKVNLVVFVFETGVPHSRQKVFTTVLVAVGLVKDYVDDLG